MLGDSLSNISNSLYYEKCVFNIYKNVLAKISGLSQQLCNT